MSAVDEQQRVAASVSSLHSLDRLAIRIGNHRQSRQLASAKPTCLHCEVNVNETGQIANTVGDGRS